MAAAAGGAHRIELCACLACGGVTPDDSFIEFAVRESGLPVFVLIRPRPGNFIYSGTEFGIILQSIARARNLGAAGIVCGSLTEQRSINDSQVRRMVDAARPLPFTFHRAFDLCASLDETLHDLVSTGVTRILTSGGRQTAFQGAGTIRQLQALAGNSVIIMPGAGINPENVSEIIRLTGVNEVHASASESRITDSDTLLAGGVPLRETSEHIVKQLVIQIQGSA